MRKELGNLVLVHPYKCEWMKIRVKNRNTEIEDFILFVNINRYLRKKYQTPVKMVAKKSLFLWVAWVSVQFSSVAQSSPTLATPWVAARQASLSITNSQSLLKLMPIESVMPSSHLILCHPLLLLPPIPPSIRVFSNESILHMRWPKYWSFSFSISPSNEHPGLISFRMDWLDLLAVQGLLRVFSNTIGQKHKFFSTQLSSQSNSHIHTWPLEKP